MATSTDERIPVTLVRATESAGGATTAARRIVEAAGAPIQWEESEAEAEVFKKGLPSGVPDETIASLSRTRVLKGPLGGLVGFGKSANVTLRKLFETYANVRPVRELGVKTRRPRRRPHRPGERRGPLRRDRVHADARRRRGPEADLGQGLGEDRSLRVRVRAQRHRTTSSARRSRTSSKLSEGTLKRAFEAAATDYPDIESWHLIVDNCAHQLVKRPEQFDVLVMTNMNGDILSDLSSALVGGLGFARAPTSAARSRSSRPCRIGAKYAGKDVINPTALILSAVLMLRYLELFEQADAIEHAVLVTLEDGTLTGDVVGYGNGASTTAYTDAIIANLGRRSEQWEVRETGRCNCPSSRTTSTT